MADTPRKWRIPTEVGILIERIDELVEEHGADLPGPVRRLRTLAEEDLREIRVAAQAEKQAAVDAGYARIKAEMAGRGPAEFLPDRPGEQHYWLGHYHSASRWEDLVKLEVGDVLLTVPVGGNIMELDYDTAYKQYCRLDRGWLSPRRFAGFKDLVGYAAAFGERIEDFPPNARLSR